MATDRIVVITGASRGIGAATARLACARGYAVCINYRASAEAAERLAEELRGGGATAIAVQADVSVESDVERLFRKVYQELGTPTALVNNAGMLEPQMRVDMMSAERIERVLATNVLGPFLCAREAIRFMSKYHGGPGGVIVNVSSTAARLGAPGAYVDYAASKGAIDTFTTGLAREVAATGIRVNCVRPAYIYTDIHASGGDPERVDRDKASIPMQRGGQADEVANAILWLMSDEAAYTTGTFIDVSGGL